MDEKRLFKDIFYILLLSILSCFIMLVFKPSPYTYMIIGIILIIFTLLSVKFLKSDIYREAIKLIDDPWVGRIYLDNNVLTAFEKIDDFKNSMINKSLLIIVFSLLILNMIPGFLYSVVCFLATYLTIKVIQHDVYILLHVKSFKIVYNSSYENVLKELKRKTIENIEEHKKKYPDNP